MSDSFKFLDEGSELQIIVEGDRDLPHIDPASQTTSLFDRIAIVPHGADTDIYYPPSQQQRQTLRQTFGWEDYFIFLNIGGQTDRKGIRPLLKAFIEGENLFILDPDWKHLIQLMQTLIEQPAFIAKARLAGPRFVSENFTWKHAVDKLLDVRSISVAS